MEGDVTLADKLSVLNGVIDTKHVNDWENSFLKGIVPLSIARAKVGQIVGLTPKQRGVIDSIYERVA